jgi:type II secretory pathway pseudopilin PulG
MIFISIAIIPMNALKFSDSILAGRRRVQGFSLVEMLTVMGAIAATTGIGVVAVQQSREASQESKLQADVGRLNNAVQTYMMNGGTIPADANADAVLARLKTKATAAAGKTVVGLTGPFIDERISGVESGTGAGPVRATWNATTKRFELATSGAGYTAFHLGGTVRTSPVTETRSTNQKFASRDSWVWDYEAEDALAVVAKPAEVMTALPEAVTQTPQGQPGPRRLLQPEFSMPSGLYPYANFPMGLTLNNPNPPGSSAIFYSLNNGPWIPYAEGSTLNMPTEILTSSLRTYAAARNTEAWNDSSSAENLYKTIFFRGATSGVFRSPIGESNLVTNLTNGASGGTFTWGRIASGYTRSNSMTFTPAANYTVVPEQEFKIGELYYYNGTIVSGTSATGIKLRLGLNFTVPERVETFEFDFRLLSTVNRGVSADEDADYVWIPNLASQMTTQVQGQTFYLQLRFGNSTANGFTTIDEFHVHENKSATGSVYGKFTTNPVF